MGQGQSKRESRGCPAVAGGASLINGYRMAMLDAYKQSALRPAFLDVGMPAFDLYMAENPEQQERLREARAKADANFEQWFQRIIQVGSKQVGDQQDGQAGAGDKGQPMEGGKGKQNESGQGQPMGEQQNEEGQGQQGSVGDQLEGFVVPRSARDVGVWLIAALFVGTAIMGLRSGASGLQAALAKLGLNGYYWGVLVLQLAAGVMLSQGSRRAADVLAALTVVTMVGQCKSLGSSAQLAEALKHGAVLGGLLLLR